MNLDEARVLQSERRFDIALLDSSVFNARAFDFANHSSDAMRDLPVLVLRREDNIEESGCLFESFATDYIDVRDLTPGGICCAVRLAIRNFSLQKELKESLEWFADVFNGVSEGVFLHDGARVLEANDAFLHMVGRDRARVIGSDVGFYFSKRSLPWLSEQGGKTDFRHEMLLRARRHRTIPVEAWTRLCDHGACAAYLVVLRDITQRKLAEEELERTTQVLEARVAQRTACLERATLELERFAEIVAHDIRAPLSAVAEWLKEVREKNVSEPISSEEALKFFFIERAFHTVERVRDLVRAVLEYSRISPKSLRKAEVRLDSILKEVVVELGERISTQNATVRVGEMPVALGDPSLLANLFRNLIDNSLKYCDVPEPLVEVNALSRDGEWEFSISDNGGGFDPEEAQVIFDMFHRSGNALQHPGAGIGLATCKKIAHLHGGRIWAVSEPGRGACFHFVLPK
jgi:PAS domain S-box-containing protein